MINSDLIKTLVIDRPNLRMNNREKIIGGDSLWRPTEAAKNRFFKVFDVIYLKVVYGSKLLTPIGSSNHYLQFLLKTFLKKPLYKTLLPKIRFLSRPLLDKKVNLGR